MKNVRYIDNLRVSESSSQFFPFINEKCFWFLVAYKITGDEMFAHGSVDTYVNYKNQCFGTPHALHYFLFSYLYWKIY